MSRPDGSSVWACPRRLGPVPAPPQVRAGHRVDHIRLGDQPARQARGWCRPGSTPSSRSAACDSRVMPLARLPARARARRVLRGRPWSPREAAAVPRRDQDPARHRARRSPPPARATSWARSPPPSAAAGVAGADKEHAQTQHLADELPSYAPRLNYAERAVVFTVALAVPRGQFDPASEWEFRLAPVEHGVIGGRELPDDPAARARRGRSCTLAALLARE